MTEPKYIIKPGIGVGDLSFGMSRDQVVETLGQPTEKESFADPDQEHEDLEEIWHYDELELSASFEAANDWVLVSLSVSGEEYRLEGTPIIGLTKDGLTAVLNDMDFGEVEYEDHSSLENPSQELIASTLFGMNFWLENGKVTEIQWNPMLMEEGELDWSE
ncbi:MAG: hypothetical protein DWQ02_09550 [Bacteroidetes bacterium]|nr:MAG: hypothetical protein DWQ02_09550 [Bacteroidota bacterium]